MGEHTGQLNRGLTIFAEVRWDKDAFEAQAKERARAAEAAADTSKRGSILAVKRDLLKGRETKVDLASRLGKSRAVESAHAAASGYHCKVSLKC